jgi:hypothetical protein
MEGVIDMIDQIYDRNYQDARAQMNADIDRGLANLARTIGRGLAVLNAYEFDAPWRRTGAGR